MIFLRRMNWLSLLLLFASKVITIGASAPGQEPTLLLRQRVIIYPALRPCDPAQVRMYSLGRQPLDAILAEVTVENNSEKVISAMKLGWRVYREQDARKISFASCPPNSASAEVLLTGATDVIQLTSLSPKETSTIGINPLPAPTSATKTVFVDHPFVTVDDVKSLVEDRDNPVSTGKYGLVIFVSEIQYNDGTRWTPANSLASIALDVRHGCRTNWTGAAGRDL
jgi:hypothetical protein